MKLRAIRAVVLSALVAATLQWPAISTAQQAFPDFADVDFCYAQRPQLFQDLWQRAESRTVRIAVLGDSQETSPMAAVHDAVEAEEIWIPLPYYCWARRSSCVLARYFDRSPGGCRTCQRLE